MPNSPLEQATVAVTPAAPAVMGPGRNGSPARHVVAREVDGGAAALTQAFGDAVGRCVELAQGGASMLDLERAVAKELARVAQETVALVFASGCQGAMQRDLRERGLSPAQVRLRADDDGYATVHTTFGPVRFPVFAYRDLSIRHAVVTHHPARELLPFQRACRSSPLSLEWEARLGAGHPFRKAEQLFKFFTRGAATVEDTRIAAHMLSLSSMVGPQWLYRTPDDVRRVLAQRATRDRKTGRPLLYSSSDAHSLRRYVGATWEAQWKNVNGIRLWCEDAVTGQVIHLGGEFTWGDCHAVGARFAALVASGVLPNGDAAWAAVDAQVVFISDGADWFKDHILPHLRGAVVLLDPYHLVEWFGGFAREVFGRGHRRGRELHAEVTRILFGKRAKPAATQPRLRRGHEKTRGVPVEHAHGRPWLSSGRPRTVASKATCKDLVALLEGLTLGRLKHQQARDDLKASLVNNAWRMDYAAYLARGYQIGSGAMESIHRNGSQCRLKLPGCRWLEESSQAVLTFRMLEIGGRWNEFWAQADIVRQMGRCFAPPTLPSRPHCEVAVPPA